MDYWREMLPLLNVRMPASGDVNMNYNAWTNWGISASEAGDPMMESEIFSNVAMPGKQLGKLTEAVLALAEAIGQDGQLEAIGELKKLATKIETKKQSLHQVAKESAESALGRLKDVDPEAYRRLIEEAHRSFDPT